MLKMNYSFLVILTIFSLNFDVSAGSLVYFPNLDINSKSRDYSGAEVRRYGEWQNFNIKLYEAPFSCVPYVAAGVCAGIGLHLLLSKLLPTNIEECDEHIAEIDHAHKKQDKMVILKYEQRLDFLQKALKDRDVSSIDLRIIAAMTQRFTRAKMERFVTVLKKIATEYDVHVIEQVMVDGQIKDVKTEYYQPITMQHIFRALESAFGGGKDFFHKDSQIKLNAAIHEAGHAVAIAQNVNMILPYISMITSSTSAARNWVIYQYESRTLTGDDYKDCIVVDLCGAVAEQVFGYNKNWYESIWVCQKAERYKYIPGISQGLRELLVIPGIKSDLVNALQAADHIVRYHIKLYATTGNVSTPQEIEFARYAILEECYQKAVKLIQEHKAYVEKIAQALMKNEIVSGEEVYALYGIKRPLYEFELKGR